MEQIKQEIINNIYENGENLITGPVLQTVLLDMVDDVNSKVASASVAPDIVDKTGSWDDAADWVEENSSSLVHENDLDGYATEQWVEDQGYLKEHQDLGGYATTESLNDLSESVANDLANLPEPDLSDYATKEYVEATSASVKEWVENKHYLTTASLSGSVTEESVQFMINDATSSVKTWVGDQNYATETFVSQAIAEIPGTDLTGYATEAWVEEQGYLKEHQDISGLATTESVNSLSESVAQDFANLPDVSGLATTESVNQLSESIAQTIEDLPQVDLNGYVTTASYNTDSASFDQRINAITGSDLSGYATTSSVNALSESVYSDSASFDQRINGINIPDVSGFATTQSVNNLSASFAETIDNIPGTDLTGYATEQWVENQGYLTEHQDISGLATTSSVNQLSSSVSSDIQSAREEATQAITGLGTIVQGVSDRVTGLSASFDDRINNITGSDVDLSGYATTSSVNQLSSSVATDIQNAREEAAAGFASVNQGVVALSASFDQRINDISGSEVDLSGYATTQSVNALSASFDSRINSLDLSGFLFGTGSASGSESIFPSASNWVVEVSQSVAFILDSELEEGRSIQVIYHNAGANSVSIYFNEEYWGPYSVVNGVLGSGSFEIPAGEYGDVVATRIGDRIYFRTSLDVSNIEVDLSEYATTESVNTLSASFDQRISSIPGSDIDLSEYATTASLNSVSQSLSASIAAGGVTLEQLQDLGLVYNNDGYWVAAEDQEHGGLPTDGEGSFWTSAPAIWRNLVSEGLIGYSEYYDKIFDTTYWSVGNTISTAEWSDNPVGALLRYVSDEKLLNWSDEDGRWVSPIVGEVEALSASVAAMTGSSADLSGYATTQSVNSLSASFDQRISSIPGSDVDLSGYATTESVNTLSASFAETIDNIPTGSGASGDYLPLTGGTLTGNLKVSASVGVGADPGGSNCLVVGGSGTETNEAHNSVAVGENCHVSIWNGFAAGRETVVEGDGAFGMATGFRNRVNGMAGYAGGCLSTASGQFSFAAGFGAVSKGTGQVVLGSFNEIDGTGTGTGSYAVILGNGKSSTWNQDDPGDVVRSNGLAIKWDGGIDINYSGSTITLQDKLAELENSADISGLATTESVNSLSASFTETIDNITETSLWKRGAASYSLEQVVEDSAPNLASGIGSLAQGSCTTASGDYSHAEGSITKATRECSHAEGDHAHAAGKGSHAEGFYAQATGSYSHAEGRHTIASNAFEHAQGKYNATFPNQIFSVGVGDVGGTRRNAISIITGSTVPYASIYLYGVGSYNGTNPQPGTNDLAAVINSLSSSLDLSGYATTQSLNVLNSRVTDLSSSFDTRISQIVAASGGLDPADFAGAPTIIYQTDGTTGLVGVNYHSGPEGTVISPEFDDTAWQLENLDLSNFDRIECYFKNSFYDPATVVTVILDSAAAGSGADTYRGTSWCPIVMMGSRQIYEVEVAVDASKTKLQVPYQFRVDTVNSGYADASNDGSYLYKIVGYPKIV